MTVFNGRGGCRGVIILIFWAIKFLSTMSQIFFFWIYRLKLLGNNGFIKWLTLCAKTEKKNIGREECRLDIYLTDRSWETERIVARLPPHAKIFLCLKWRFIYIIQFAKAIWSHGGHIWLFWPHFGSKNELFTESPFELPKRAILSEME